MKLPIGVENFKEIRTDNFYYVDKTNFIKEFILKCGKVNVFTRLRRFGKSLNTNMLKYFFEIGKYKTLFEGLDIAQEKELCEKYMGKYPVVSVSLKDINTRTFESACDSLKDIIGKEALRFSFLAKSDNLNEMHKKCIKA